MMTGKFKQLTIKDVQQEAAKYKDEFDIGPHSLWFQSGSTTLGIAKSTITVIDCDGNSVECSINEIISYVLFTGESSDVA